MSLWVKPETWDVGDAAMRFFVTVNEGEQKPAHDGGTFLWLYRFFSRSTYFLVWDSRGYPVLAAADPKQFPDVFATGQWVHLLGAWSGDELSLYINGRLQGRRRVSTPTILRSLAREFTVGSENRANAADTVLDELRLFSRALTPPEVEALYRFEFAAAPAQQEITVTNLPGAKTVHVDVNAIARRPDETGGLSARVQLRSAAGGEPLASAAIARFGACHAPAELSTAGLAPGDYVVTATLLAEGNEVASTEAKVRLSPPPGWLGSTVGLAAEVPAPWTPLQVVGERELVCWGPRRYQVGGVLFPAGLSSLRQELLASPIRLSGTANGATLEPGPAQTTWAKVTPARVEFAATAPLAGGAVATESFLEFDGLLWTTLRFLNRKPLQLSALTLDIPLRREAATLMQTGFGIEDAGAVRPWSHRVSAHAQVWLGNEDGGLQWTIPSARFWRNANRDRQLEIVPAEDRVILRLHLIDGEALLPPEAEYSFGIQLTPVRPHPAGWRQWRITPPAGVPGTRLNPFYLEGWALGTSYPIPLPQWERVCNEAAAKGDLPTLYLQPCSIWQGMPDYPDFAAEWRTTYCNAPLAPDPQAPPTSFMGVCPRPSSWAEYLVTTFCNLYQGKHKDMGWGAVYFDVTTTPVCDNADHGCGYLDEFGVRQGEQRYLEHRAVQRRFFTALKERWPRKLLFNHESGSLNMMQLGFCEGMIDGEHLCLALPPDGFSYAKILPLERMRAEFMGHNFGFVPIFLPEFTRAGAGNTEVTTRFMVDPEPPEVMHLLGLLLLHDIVPWPAYSNATPYVHWWAVQDAFGWDDQVEFLPYWRNGDRVTLSPVDPNLVCTLYRRPGKLLAVVMNNTDADREVTLGLDLAGLGVAAGSVLDAWKAASFQGLSHEADPARPNAWPATPVQVAGREERLPLDQGVVRLSVGKRSFRLLSAP
jgi:hypothetical protein